MNGVLSLTTLARQDAAIGIGRTQRLGARWRRSSNPDGSAPESFDMSGYTGELRISGDDGQKWLVKPLTFDSASGVVSAVIDPADTASPAWLARTTGRWAILATNHSGETVVVVAGIIRITQEGF